MKLAKAEQRHELVLQAAALSDQIDLNDGELDEGIFSLGEIFSYSKFYKEDF